MRTSEVTLLKFWRDNRTQLSVGDIYREIVAIAPGHLRSDVGVHHVTSEDGAAIALRLQRWADQHPSPLDESPPWSGEELAARAAQLVAWFAHGATTVSIAAPGRDAWGAE